MKMFGIVKWFKDVKGYGYIIGVDDETYFFERIDCINKSESFASGDKVMFVPSFLDMDFAKEVEKVESHE